MIIVGDKGIGKTRFILELAERILFLKKNE
jgi:hypothetical protein